MDSIKRILIASAIGTVVSIFLLGVFFIPSFTDQPILGAIQSGHNIITGGVTNASTSVSLNNSTVVLIRNTNRQYALIQNISSNDIDCSIGATAASQQGMRLLANGGTYEMNSLNLFYGAVNCVASVATGTVVTIER